MRHLSQHPDFKLTDEELADVNKQILENNLRLEAIAKETKSNAEAKLVAKRKVWEKELREGVLEMLDITSMLLLYSRDVLHKSPEDSNIKYEFKHMEDLLVKIGTLLEKVVDKKGVIQKPLKEMNAAQKAKHVKSSIKSGEIKIISNTGESFTITKEEFERMVQK